MTSPEISVPETSVYMGMFLSIFDELQLAYPQDCRSCVKVELPNQRLAEAVVFGDIGRDNANDQAHKEAEDLANHCISGRVAVDGCFGGSRCGYDHS